MNAPVSVMETAGEGGAWGIALLASYMRNREEGETSVEIEREQAIRFMQDNIEKDAWLEEFFPRQMEVYHNAIEQTKEQLLMNRIG